MLLGQHPEGHHLPYQHTGEDLAHAALVIVARLVLPARERLGNFSYSGNQVGFGGSNELQGELDGTADYAFCR